jgi:hypothetical protein
MQVTIDPAILSIEALLAKPHLEEQDLDSARRTLKELLAERIEDHARFGRSARLLQAWRKTADHFPRKPHTSFAT